MTFYDRVYEVVRTIPRGKVMTYGQIARLLGSPRAARAVGYALQAGLEAVPWQRVINERGTISQRGDGSSGLKQRVLLEAEGVEFGLDGRCDLEEYRYRP